LWWNYINFQRSIHLPVRTNSSRYFFLRATHKIRAYINGNIYFFANFEINYLPIFPEIYLLWNPTSMFRCATSLANNPLLILY
jgi:hypothetical protein